MCLGSQGGEDHNQLVKVILNANRELAKTRYGSDAVSFQLAQVGNDLKARAFLEELDSHREIGGLIDVSLLYISTTVLQVFRRRKLNSSLSAENFSSYHLLTLAYLNRLHQTTRMKLIIWLKLIRLSI